MGSRLREDEKNEKIIRGLAKLPANRRCINCNSQSTQYVCTNFSTFICIQCSGIHREFTHRVKSISMANFTSREITALQEGGNERAKGIYFKEWDFQRYTLPNNSDVDKLRDFIKHIYVDGRFKGDKNAKNPPPSKIDKDEQQWIQERSSGASLDPQPSPVKKKDDKNSDDRQKDVPPPVREVVQVIIPKLNKPGTPKPTPTPAIQSVDKKDTSTQIAPEVKSNSNPIASISLIDFDSDPVPGPKQQTATSANHNKDVGWASFDTQKSQHVESTCGPGPANINTVPQNMVPQNNRQLYRPPSMGPTSQTHHFTNGPGAGHLAGTPNTRNTLPEDMFGTVYGGVQQTERPGWQGAPLVMMGYAAQYPIQSSNPFDVVSEPKLYPANSFPAMGSLHAALPNPNPTPNPNSLSRAYSMPYPSPYMPQQIPNNMFYNNGNNQVMGGYGMVGNGFGLMGMNPHGSIRNPQQGNLNSYSQVGRNPFS